MTQNRYMLWMGLHSYVTSISSVLCTNSMLSSIMNKPTYTDIISFTYVGKDIIGQLGGLLYLMKNGKKADTDPNKHLKRAVLLQQVAFNLENSSILITNSDFILP